MKDCPQCHKPADGLVCPYCGYSETAADDDRRDYHLEHFPDRTVRIQPCANVELGLRCAMPGTLASSHKGPWWCAKHFPVLRR